LLPFEVVAFSFPVPGLSHEFSALPFPVHEISLPPVHLAKQAAINHRATTVMTQSGVPVAQLVLALS
jgi:hypothetical protein